MKITYWSVLKRFTEPSQGALSSLFFLVLLLLSFNTGAQTFIDVRVIRVSDGDTLQVSANASRFTVRLAGIDAPESKQDYGPEASKTLRAIISDQRVTLNCFKTDRYQRKVCRAYLGEQDIAQILLETGAAWVYRDYLRELIPDEGEAYLTAENTAKKAQICLWRGLPVPPWVYR